MICRRDYLLLIDVKNANPNGDPNCDNLPRMNDTNGHGIISNVCIKRKIRNAMLAAGERLHDEIGVPVNRKNKKIAKEVNSNLEKGTKNSSVDATKKRQDAVLKEFIDARIFGFMGMTGKKDAERTGKLTGPIQFSHAETILPIVARDIGSVRATRPDENDSTTLSTFSSLPLVFHGLYAATAALSGPLANKAGVSEADLEAFEAAVVAMFDDDASGARPPGSMRVVGFYKIMHNTERGNGSAVSFLVEDVFEVVATTKEPQSYKDYHVAIHADKVPVGCEFDAVVDRVPCDVIGEEADSDDEDDEISE